MLIHIFVGCSSKWLVLFEKCATANSSAKGNNTRQRKEELNQVHLSK
jgi:hypothetical protein